MKAHMHVFENILISIVGFEATKTHLVVTW